MPDVTFKKVTNVEQLPAVKNGQITAVTKTGQLFVDMDGERVCYSGIVYNTDAAILATQTPWRNTLYIATDTGKLYVPDWKLVNGRWIYCGWDNLIEHWQFQFSDIFAAFDHIHAGYAQLNHTHYFADINTGAGGLLITRAALTFTLEDYALEDHNHDAAYCPKWTNATMANNAVTLSTRKQWRYGANDITTVTITLNTGTITEFSALATFGTSSATPTVTITTTGSYTVKMVGSDCLDGTFTPYASTRYTIAFYWDGLYIIGKVSGYAYG